MSWRIPVEIPLPENFKGFDPQSTMPLPEFTAYERNLPHWRLPGACYVSTFRLNDSIPMETVRAMRKEMQTWKLRMAKAAADNQGRLPPAELADWDEFQRRRLRKLESLLDEGHGKCLLRDERHRGIVGAALHHFEGARCEMLAFAIMPNHAHTLCRPLHGHDLENLTGSWKRHSAERINRLTSERGALWQAESFDRIIRDAAHYRQAVRYIAKNPSIARLRADEATVWFCHTICEANHWEP